MKNLRYRIFLLLPILTACFLFTVDSRAQDFESVLCKDPARPNESPRTEINGIALIVDATKSETQFLVALDYELALLAVDSDGKVLRCSRLKWEGITPKPTKQLEALTAIPDACNQFLALREDGVIYHIKYTDGKAEIIGDAFDVPDKPADVRDFEGLALQKIGSEYIIAWARRGRDKNPPAALSWSKFNVIAPLSPASFEGIGEVGPKGEKLRTFRTQPISVDYPNAQEKRDITDLKIDTSGKVFIISVSDTDEVKPGDRSFPAAFYLAGAFGITGGKSVFTESKPYGLLKKFSGQKVEALELLPGKRGGVAFATDNEGSATFWFPSTVNEVKGPPK